MLTHVNKSNDRHYFAEFLISEMRWISRTIRTYIPHSENEYRCETKTKTSDR